MARKRPEFHFTQSAGWINDPHGVVFDGAQWHLFFQACPDSISWVDRIEWGHATSTDLVRWQEQPVALVPLPDEVGCWSGSVVFDETGLPWLFYTSPLPSEWGHGRVVRARGTADLAEWTREPVDFLIDGPPAAEYFDFRDPNVWREGDRWRMVVGAGKRDFGGVALVFESLDLLNWEFRGELASRSSALEPRTGTVWECPQYLEVDGRRVLLISAMDGADLSRMIYAVGDEVSGEFVAASWGVLEHSGRGYATTTFRDRDGLPALIHWVREQPGVVAEDFSGAQSVTYRMHVVGDELHLTWHPDVVQALGSSIREFTAEPGAVIPLGETGRLVVSEGGDRLDYFVGDERWFTVPTGSGRVRFVEDVDLVELLVDGVPGGVSGRIG